MMRICCKNCWRLRLTPVGCYMPRAIWPTQISLANFALWSNWFWAKKIYFRQSTYLTRFFAISSQKCTFNIKPTPSNFDREKLEKMLAKLGIWQTPAADSYKKCSLVSIYMAKMLPGFAQLGLDDQVFFEIKNYWFINISKIASIHGFVAASFHFSSRFFSMRKYSRTSLMNTMDYPIARMFTVAYGNDPM